MMSTFETHEPDEPLNWPDGHVGVRREPGGSDPGVRLKLGDFSVSITDPEDDECILISAPGGRHFLHSTTARALSDKLVYQDGHAVEITIHGVTYTAGRTASRGFAQELKRRLAEWNKLANAWGFPGV